MPAPRKWLDVEKNCISVDYRQGLGLKEIAKKNKTSYHTIKKILNELNIDSSRKKIPHYAHAEAAAKLGKVVLQGLYKGAATKTIYRCLAHYQIHESLPSNILNGHGLKCCHLATTKARAESQRLNTKREYDGKLKSIGRLQRDEEYIDDSTPIWHKCLRHGKRARTTPNHALKGRGIYCCQFEGFRSDAQKRNKNAANSFRARLREKTDRGLWHSGDYIDSRTKINFFCINHEEVHPALPNDVLGGKGLKCCKREAVRKVGRQTGPLNSASFDNVWRALLGVLERTGPAELYLYASPQHGYFKYGISKRRKARAQQGGYGEQLMEPRFYPMRDDAVLVEQAFKFGWGIEPPDCLKSWPGCTELTCLHPNEFIDIVMELEQFLLDEGRWGFAEKYCDPRQLLRA